MKHAYVPLFLFLTACKVGPDYHEPQAELPVTFVETKEEKIFAPTDEQLTGWWNCFHDPFLNSLLEEAVSGNFDYRIALEQVAQARSEYWVQFAQILPELDFDAQGSRFRTSQSFLSQNPATTTATTSTATVAPATLTSPASISTDTTTATTTGAKISPVQNFFQLGFDAIWEIDLFGKLRRTADASHDTFEAVQETSQFVKITMLSEVVNTYTTICAFQEKVALQTSIVNSDEHIVTLLADRFSSGLSSEQEVQAAHAVLTTDTASLKTLQTGLKESIYSLAVLLGKNPEAVLEDFFVKRPLPTSRGKIPAGLPADLLKRRHDIRSAERQLAAATENVGVAVAQLYPSISITGSSSSFAANPLQGSNYGLSSDKLHKLFKNKSRIWGIGGLLTVPVFDFGKRLAGIDVQEAIQKQAALSYQKTVISALEEVEAALAAYFDEEEREANLAETEKANKRSYDLVFSLFEAGLADATQLSNAQNSWLGSASTHTDSLQTLTTDLIAVYKSLGGDW